ncbi:MAG: SRPBCC family protein [Acidimicrobiales bacterium]
MGATTSDKTSVHIQASPEAVYALVSAMPRMGGWSPECYRCGWAHGDGPSVGAELKGYNRVGPVRWTAEGRVTAAERGREFAFVTLYKGRREETPPQSGPGGRRTAHLSGRPTLTRASIASKSSTGTSRAVAHETKLRGPAVTVSGEPRGARRCGLWREGGRLPVGLAPRDIQSNRCSDAGTNPLGR